MTTILTAEDTSGSRPIPYEEIPGRFIDAMLVLLGDVRERHPNAKVVSAVFWPEYYDERADDVLPAAVEFKLTTNGHIFVEDWVADALVYRREA